MHNLNIINLIDCLIEQLKSELRKKKIEQLNSTTILSYFKSSMTSESEDLNF